LLHTIELQACPSKIIQINEKIIKAGLKKSRWGPPWGNSLKPKARFIGAGLIVLFGADRFLS
jgi:hypothetical protein